MKSIILGRSASFFFAFTFVLNRQMSVSGGNWIWSAALRYIFMFPILLLIMIMRKELFKVIKEIKKQPVSWIMWSTVGFGMFYAPLTFASAYGPSWLVAGTWQFTIIAGILLSPLFFESIKTEEGIIMVRNRIPVKALCISVVILFGIVLMQTNGFNKTSLRDSIIGVIPVIIAAFAYPLGNRKMMEVCEHNLNTYQRVFGMTLCSMPLWIILSVIGYINAGAPSGGQILQSFTVAICSGIVATILFFKATDMAKGNPHQLAAVEATQAGEVLFTLLGEVLIFHEMVPSKLAMLGMIIVIAGMTLHSLSSNNREVSTVTTLEL